MKIRGNQIIAYMSSPKLIFLLIVIIICLWIIWKYIFCRKVEGFDNKQYIYIPDLKNIENQLLTGKKVSFSSLNLNELEPSNKINFQVNELIAETISAIDYLKYDYLELENQDEKNKFDLDAEKSDLLKKVKQIRDGSGNRLDKQFSQYFIDINEESVREFDEKIKPINDLVDMIHFHVWSEDTEKPLSEEKDVFKSYYLTKMEEYRGNAGQLNDLKLQLYSFIEPSFTMNEIVREYINNYMFYNSYTDIPFILNIAKDRLKQLIIEERTDESLSPFTNIDYILYNYVKIYESLYLLLENSRQTSSQMKNFESEYIKHMDNKNSIIKQIFISQK